MGKEAESPVVEKPDTPWHAMSLEEVYKELGKDATLVKSGLTSTEAEERLEQYGENKMSTKEKKSLLKRIWDLVANVLVGILVFVAVVSAIRALTTDDSDVILTNWIQVGLITFVIT